MSIFATNVLIMERRAMLKNMVLLGVGASLPLKTLLARQNATVTGVGRPFHQFKLGELDLFVITDGSLVMSPVQPSVAPDGPPAAVDSLLKNSFRSTTDHIKANARERVGTPPPERILPDPKRKLAAKPKCPYRNIWKAAGAIHCSMQTPPSASWRRSASPR